MLQVCWSFTVFWTDTALGGPNGDESWNKICIGKEVKFCKTGRRSYVAGPVCIAILPPDKTDKIDHLGFCNRSWTVICPQNPSSLLDGHKHVPGSLRSWALEGQQPIHCKRGYSNSKGKRKTVRVIGSIEKFNLPFLKTYKLLIFQSFRV